MTKTQMTKLSKRYPWQWLTELFSRNSKCQLIIWIWINRLITQTSQDLDTHHQPQQGTGSTMQAAHHLQREFTIPLDNKFITAQAVVNNTSQHLHIGHKYTKLQLPLIMSKLNMIPEHIMSTSQDMLKHPTLNTTTTHTPTTIRMLAQLANSIHQLSKELATS